MVYCLSNKWRGRTATDPRWPSATGLTARYLNLVAEVILSIHWYAHHIGDYVKNTQQLSMLQHGAYRLLLDYYYTNEGPIPTDTKILYRICRCMNQHDRAAVDYVLSKYFIWEERKSMMPHDSVWHHGRADEELSKTRNISEIRKTSASKRYANAGANAHTTYNHNHNHNINKEGELRNGHRKPSSGREAAEQFAESIREENLDIN